MTAFAPRLMQAASAAHYLGVSVSKFRRLGFAPIVLGGNRLYDRHDLDAYADALAEHGESAAGKSCDEAFGVQP